MRFTLLSLVFLFTWTIFATEKRDMNSNLDFVIATGKTVEARKLIAGLKDVDIFLGKAHETPLTLAAMNARPQIVKMLLDRKAKVNHQMDTGYTALMFVALGRNGDRAVDEVETAKLLIAAGADKTLKNNRGETALDIAKLTKKTELIPLLQ